VKAHWEYKRTSDHSKTIRQNVIMQSGDKPTHFRSVSDRTDPDRLKWWQADSFLLSFNLTVLPWLLFTKVHSLVLANFYAKIPGVLDHWIILYFNTWRILLNFTVFPLNTMNIWHHSINLSQPVPTMLSLHSLLKLIRFLPHDGSSLKLCTLYWWYNTTE